MAIERNLHTLLDHSTKELWALNMTCTNRIEVTAKKGKKNTEKLL